MGGRRAPGAGVTIGAAGLAAFIVIVVQVVAAICVLGLAPAQGDDLDYFVVGILLVLGLIGAVPGFVAALVVWRRGRGRAALIVAVVPYLLWHVFGFVVVSGVAHSGAYEAFVLPGAEWLTIGYQALMSCALIAVIVAATVAVQPPRMVADPPVMWSAPAQAGGPMVGPSFDHRPPGHLGPRKSD